MAVTVTCHKASQYPLLPEISVRVVKDKDQVCHVLVSSEPAGGVSSAAGVTAGDIITRVNNTSLMGEEPGQVCEILSGMTGQLSVICQKLRKTSEESIVDTQIQTLLKCSKKEGSNIN